MFESDQHASEALYHWYKQNKLALFGFVVVLFGGTYLTQSWLENKTLRIKQSSLKYSNLIGIFNLHNDTNKLQHKINSIIATYPKTPYADLASILNTKIFIEKNDVDNAILSLNNVINNSNQPAVRDVAKLRLVRIYLDRNQLLLAKEQLNKISKLSDNSSLYHMLKGDVSTLEKNYQTAINDYKLALKFLPMSKSETVLNKIIKVKLYKAKSMNKA